MVEQALYRLSPIGPILTTIAIGVFVYSLFLFHIWATQDFQAFIVHPEGQSVLRIAFILTLILCAALGVGQFDERANCRDAAELEKEFGLKIPPRRIGGRGMLWATAGGFVAGLGFLAVLVWTNADGNFIAFANSIGLWFIPMTPLLWTLMARGVYGSITAGQHMSKLIRTELEIDLYRHHELTIFGRIAMRGAFIWLIFVGIILLFLSDQGSSVFAQPTLFIAISVAIFNFVSTMQPVRKKIRAAKEAEKQTIRERLIKARAGMNHGDPGADVPALIALEDRIEKIREWPLDLPTAARLPLYVLIPVVPWAFGIYAETFLSGFFGGS